VSYGALADRLMGITNPLHIKRIKLAIERVHRPDSLDGGEQGGSVWARRKKIRIAYEEGQAAAKIQRQFRRYAAQKLVWQIKTRLAAIKSRQAVAEQIVAKDTWYTQLVPTSEDVKLKTFGRRRPVASARGWGSWRDEHWVAVLEPDEALYLRNRELDGHDSGFWVQRLELKLEQMQRDNLALGSRKQARRR
jgi:hypothetical protein